MNPIIASQGVKPGDRLEFIPLNRSAIELKITRNERPLLRRDNQINWIFGTITLYDMSRIADVIAELSSLKSRLMDNGKRAGLDYGVFRLEESQS